MVYEHPRSLVHFTEVPDQVLIFTQHMKSEIFGFSYLLQSINIYL
jgi:hypothetical protein